MRDQPEVKIEVEDLAYEVKKNTFREFIFLFSIKLVRVSNLSKSWASS